jgi:hypothetical protein
MIVLCARLSAQHAPTQLRTKLVISSMNLGHAGSLCRIAWLRPSTAMACLPFESPKLAVIAQVNDTDFAAILDRRLKRLETLKATTIDATPVINGEKVDARLPPRLA